MEKGLRCPNCDTTINRKVVHDWIHNKTASHLNCANQFCNVRWSRAVLKANAALFSGAAATAPKPALKKTPVVETKKPEPRKRAPASKRALKNQWLHRMRKVAKGHAKKHGVVSIDVLRRHAEENNDHPESTSAWGSVFQTDEWTKVSEMNSTRKAARSRKVSVWALKAATPMVASA